MILTAENKRTQVDMLLYFKIYVQDLIIDRMVVLDIYNVFLVPNCIYQVWLSNSPFQACVEVTQPRTKTFNLKAERGCCNLLI